MQKIMPKFVKCNPSTLTFGETGPQENGIAICERDELTLVLTADPFDEQYSLVQANLLEVLHPENTSVPIRETLFN